MRPLGSLGVAFASLLLVHCGPPVPTGPDAGDAGTQGPDAGETTPDAGETTPDAGETTPDAGRPDCTMLSVDEPAGASVYLDDMFIGIAPLTLAEPALGVTLTVADETLGVRRVTYNGPDAACQLRLDDAVTLQPREWKALYLVVKTAVADGCSLDFSDSDETALEEFFLASLETIERDSFGLVRWEVEQRATVSPVALSQPGGYYTLERDDLSALDDVEDGDFDNVFVVYRGVDENCEIPAPYFGLAFGPDPTTAQAGFTVVRIPDADFPGLLSYLADNDPGVFVHEWLHTSADNHYGARGANLPPAGSDGSVVHSATDYGYDAPWMSWYRDLLRGQVLDGESFAGVGPEWLATCTIRDGYQDLCP